MDYQIKRTNTGISFSTDIIIQCNIEKLWQLISTTEGFNQWFPELKADNLEESKVIHFEMEGFKEEMNVLVLKRPFHLSYGWAEGTVAFSLSIDSAEITELKFEEFLPFTFLNISQDLAGWWFELQKIKAVAEKKVFPKDKELINQQAEKIGKQLSELKEN